MYKVSVRINPSGIEGKGVFADQDIAKDTKVRVFKEHYDVIMTATEHDALPQETKDEIDKTGYLSPWTGVWVFPPKDDPAQYTNHSKQNNLSVKFDEAISPEPYFIANRGIKSGEELTNNYHEFDKITRKKRPDWSI